ncbi:hypothetical protein DESC_610276 [Desulfosarcina cetonica]|nr:hypothetical protein DESC_610276 [Desulfosarcina cetonica]
MPGWVSSKPPILRRSWKISISSKLVKPFFDDHSKNRRI